MTRNVVTTELVADQPVVVVIHHDQSLAHQLVTLLSKEKIQVEAYSVAELLQSRSIQQRLDEAYKIAWVTGTEQYVKGVDELTHADQLVANYQHKLTLLFPVITAFTEQVTGELPYAAKLLSSQMEAILFHNTFLPASTFLFGQDIVEQHLKTSFLPLLSQDLSRGKVYSPTVNFHPQSAQSYLLRAMRYFLQPQRSSILIRGNSVMGTSIAQEIKQLYQSYHFSLIDIQQVVVSAEQTIPFSVVENFVTDDVVVLVTKYVQALPTPAALPKSSIWKELFGVDTSSYAEYGTEVQPSVVATGIQPQYEEIATTPSQPPVIPMAAARLLEESQPEVLPPTLLQLPKEAPTETVTEDPNPVSQSPSPTENFDLNQEIQSIFSETHVSNKQTQTKRIQEKKKVSVKKSKKRTAFFYGGLAFTGMGLGIVCLALIFMFSVGLLKKSVTSFLVEKVTAAEATVPDTGQLESINRLKSMVSLQAETYSLLLSLPALEDAQNLVSLSENLKSVAANSDEADQLSKMLYLQTMGLESGDVITTAQNLNDKALTAYESLSLFYEKLNTFAGPAASPELKTSLETYKSELESKKNSIQVQQYLSPLLSDLLGISKKRTYAVIFQNNQELRPTGGFIEDVALVTFENGTLISSSIQSGYEVDKKLDGSVIPPQEIKKYLNEEGWNFVDGNWNPHFPDAATQLTWFIEKSMGVVVDGVITIDLDGMASVLEATGPLDLPQYNEVLTHKNLFDRFEFHSEISLVDSSQDYRKTVFQAFFHKITNLPQEKIIPFFGAVQKNFADQHMLISFASAEELNTVKTLSWSGSLLQPNCPTQLTSDTCIVDTIAQVEANVGVNKANYYLKRSIDHSVALTATQSAHTRTITFENTAQTDSWPRGPYKAFVRLYVPSSALPGTVSIDGVQIPTPQLIITQENNRQVIGFYVEVPVKQTKKVTANFTVPYSLKSNSFSYTFFEQQQPGAGSTPFTLRVSPESSFKPTLIAPQAELTDKSIVFTKSKLGHGFFGIKFN